MFCFWSTPTPGRRPLHPGKMEQRGHLQPSPGCQIHHWVQLLHFSSAPIVNAGLLKSIQVSYLSIICAVAHHFKLNTWRCFLFVFRAASHIKHLKLKNSLNVGLHVSLFSVWCPLDSKKFFCLFVVPTVFESSILHRPFWPLSSDAPFFTSPVLSSPLRSSLKVGVSGWGRSLL